MVRRAASPIEVGEFVLGRGEADVEAFGPRRPALFVGFCDAGDQVVGDPRPVAAVEPGQRGVNAQQRASDTTVFGL